MSNFKMIPLGREIWLDKIKIKGRAGQGLVLEEFQYNYNIDLMNIDGGWSKTMIGGVTWLQKDDYSG